MKAPDTIELPGVLLMGDSATAKPQPVTVVVSWDFGECTKDAIFVKNVKANIVRALREARGTP